MKRLIYILLPILAIVVAIAVILFTPFGSNRVLKPIANSYINKKIKKPKIIITKLDSKYGYIDANLKSDNGIKANIKGDIDYFGKKFDLEYRANALSVNVDNRDIRVDLDITGQAVGGAKDIGVNGSGSAFGSDLNYKFIVKDSKPQEIVANIKSAQIAKIFALLNQGAIVDGLLFVNANLAKLDMSNPKGEADIKVLNGVYNRGYIFRKYGLKIPKDEKFISNIQAKVDGKYLIALGDFNSTSAKLKLKKVTTTLDFKVAKGYYILTIPNLAKLKDTLKSNLQGELTLTGVFYANLAKKIYQVTTTTKSLGGEAKVAYNSNSAKVRLKKVSVVKILHMLKMPYYVTSGLINGAVDVKDIKHLNGAFNINTNGELNKKLLKVKLPSYRYNISSKGILQSGLLSINRASVLTSFVNLSLHNVKYSLLTNAVKGSFVANFDNLRALEMFTKIKLNGKLKSRGSFQIVNSSVNLKANTKSLGGDLNFKYGSNRLIANLKDISLSKALYTLNQPNFIKSGTISGDLKITNLDKLDGTLNLKSSGALNTLTIKKIYDINLGDRFKYALTFKDATIKKGVIDGALRANTTLGAINFSKFSYNINNSAFNGKYSANIDNLARLKPIVGQMLNGSFRFRGTIKQSPNQLLFTAIAKELGGVINLMVDNQTLRVDTAGLSVVAILKMLNYDQSLDGVAKLKLNYNLDNKRGTFKLRLDEARFLNSKFVQMLKHYANFDLSKEIFSSAVIDGDIDRNIITFNLDTSSQRVKISTQNAKIDTKSQTIDARVTIVYKNQDYSFRVSGDINNPKIKLIFGGYVKRKVEKKIIKKLGIDKDIEKIIPNELKENNQTKEQIKKVIPKEVKSLFDKIL